MPCHQYIVNAHNTERYDVINNKAACYYKLWIIGSQLLRKWITDL